MRKPGSSDHIEVLCNLGALLAAHWIAGGNRRGVFEFAEVLDEILDAGKGKAR